MLHFHWVALLFVCLLEYCLWFLHSVSLHCSNFIFSNSFVILKKSHTSWWKSTAGLWGWDIDRLVINKSMWGWGYLQVIKVTSPVQGCQVWTEPSSTANMFLIQNVERDGQTDTVLHLMSPWWAAAFSILLSLVAFLQPENKSGGLPCDLHSRHRHPVSPWNWFLHLLCSRIASFSVLLYWNFRD